MPYNTTPIDPPAPGDYTGAANLPLARVKKIISADDDIGACSNNASFAITIATECFIRYLAEQTLIALRAERKPRKYVVYKDVATAVHKYDNLEFLVDVVPKTITYKQWKEKQDRLEKTEREKGQRTLGEMVGTKGRPIELDGAVEEEDVVMGGSEEEEEGEESEEVETGRSARRGYDAVRDGFGHDREGEGAREES